MTTLGLVPDFPFVSTGVPSIDRALTEFADAATAYALAQVQGALLADISFAIHEVCCLQRFVVANAALNTEIQRYATSAVHGANYDDATIAELLGGIQG
ncbi:hypothetical protein ACJEIK_26355 [Mycobacterium sp. SMC-16]|uniref:hypothetical protein n=1 Tax=Mycobacterium sp. SMC-16 TaxID=3385967 RepID=UPI00390C4B2D